MVLFDWITSKVYVKFCITRPFFRGKRKIFFRRKNTTRRWHSGFFKYWQKQSRSVTRTKKHRYSSFLTTLGNDFVIIQTKMFNTERKMASKDRNIRTLNTLSFSYEKYTISFFSIIEFYIFGTVLLFKRFITAFVQRFWYK